MLPGGEVLKHVANLSHQSEPGSRKLEGFIKFIICGNTRKVLPPVGNRSHRCIRSLEARKETRENAWQIDGWAETVSKVRYTSCVGMEGLTILQTSQLAKAMDSFILLPLPYSPLK